MSCLMVAAIDFGTTYSGWAFSLKHDFERDPMNVTAKNWSGDQLVSSKAPTCVLIKPDGKTFHSFGYKAETKYAELGEDDLHRPWYFFRRFKMMMFDKTKIERKVLLEDQTGRKLPVKLVFSLVIRYLKNDLLKECHKQLADALDEKDIQWVLTVPAIWKDAAKQFMKEAAEENFTIMEKFERKSQGNYLNQMKRNIITAVKAKGPWLRCNTVNAPLTVFWAEAMHVFKQKHMDDYIDVLRTFEVKKREISPSGSAKITLRLPPSLGDTVLEVTGKTFKAAILASEFHEQITYLSGKIRVEANIVRSFFKKSVDSIVRHVSSLIQDGSARDCSAVLMVGGFSESRILQDAMEKHFPNKTKIVPEGAGLAVLKGAVMFGHRPTTIVERISKYTYGERISHINSSKCKHPACRTSGKDGTLRCCDFFDKHVIIGQAVKLGEEQPETKSFPIEADQTHITFPIYASTSTNPVFVAEPGCTKLGKLTVKIPDTSLGRDREFGIRFIFGGTEIAVKVEDKATGEVYIKAVDFLK